MSEKKEVSEPINSEILVLTEQEIQTFDPITRTAAKMMIARGKARLVEV